MPAPIISQEILKELLHYNPETGAFTWRERDIKWFSDAPHCRTWNTKYSGKEAGSEMTTIKGKRYILICVFFKRHRAHRLAWLYMKGSFPDGEIDHINGSGSDNRINNLRDVTTSENNKNVRLRSDNTSGFTGVRWFKRDNNWRARIVVNKKEIHLGYFDSIEDAIKARKEANIRYGFHPNHGQSRPL